MLVRIVVPIEQTEAGVRSTHYAATDAEAELLAQQPHGGQQLVVFGLTTEAVRREALLAVGLLHKNDPARFDLLRQQDPKERGLLAEQVVSVIAETGRCLIGRAIEDAMQAVGASNPKSA